MGAAGSPMPFLSFDHLDWESLPSSFAKECEISTVSQSFAAGGPRSDAPPWRPLRSFHPVF